jgi:hypothetical protein
MRHDCRDSTRPLRALPPVISCEEMFRGTVDSAQVYPREVVKRALVLNAAAVMAHNRHSLRNRLIRQWIATEQSTRYPQKYPHRGHATRLWRCGLYDPSRAHRPAQNAIAVANQSGNKPAPAPAARLAWYWDLMCASSTLSLDLGLGRMGAGAA